MQVPGNWKAMAIFMMKLPKPSTPGSQAPAQTLTHPCCTHHQHHHKTFLHHTHFSAPVRLAKTLISYDRAQQCPGEHIPALLATAATGLCISLNCGNGPKVPGQQGSTTPTDGCKCSCCGHQVILRTMAVPDWEEDASYYIFSRALFQQVPDT